MPIVYRYLPAYAAISTLRLGLLWLARPECFNDVFELRPHFQSLERFQLPIPKGATEAVRVLIGEKQADLDKQLLRPAIKDTLIDGHTKTIVVLSLAETCDSLRMWAHYADAHRGVALGFDTDTGILESSQQQRLQKVNYSKIRPSRALWEEVTNDELLFTKSDEWIYEQEWRLVESHFNADDSGVKEPGHEDTPIHYSFRFKPESLRRIIIGCRASKDVEREIETLVAEKYKSVEEVRKAKRHPTDYRIEIGYTWERD